MADYPDGVYSPRTKENKAGVEYAPAKKTVGFAEDVTKLDDEVIAIETELGTNPKGVFASVKELLAYLINITKSRARAYRATSVQVIPKTTVTKVEFNAETYDNLGEYDHVTNFRFTAKKAGYRQIISSIRWFSSVDQSVHQLRIYKNISMVTLNAIQSSGTSYFSQTVSDIIYLDVDDYIEIKCYQDTGGDINVHYGTENTFLSIHRLS